MCCYLNVQFQGQRVKKVKRTHLVNKLSAFRGIIKFINAFTASQQHCSRFAIKHSYALLIYPIPGVLHVHSSPSRFFYGATAPSGQAYPHYRSFTITFRHNTLDRTLDGWSGRRTDFYRTTHQTCKRQTSMDSRGYEPTIPTSVWLQTYAWNRAATWISSSNSYTLILLWVNFEISLGIPKRQKTFFFYITIHKIITF